MSERIAIREMSEQVDKILTLEKKLAIAVEALEEIHQSYIADISNGIMVCKTASNIFRTAEVTLEKINNHKDVNNDEQISKKKST